MNVTQILLADLVWVLKNGGNHHECLYSFGFSGHFLDFTKTETVIGSQPSHSDKLNHDQG